MRRYLALTAFLLAAATATPVHAGGPVNRYVEAGVPATTRTWDAADYARTLGILKKSAGLPFYKDPDGRALLDRITSRDNLAPLRDTRQPLAGRLDLASDILDRSGDILQLYVDEMEKKGRGQSEFANLTAFILRGTQEIVLLLGEVRTSQPGSTDAEDARKGLNTMKKDLVTLARSTELTLRTGKNLTPQDRQTLLAAMSDTLPAFAYAFDPEFRTELRTRLQADKRQFRGKEETERLDSMIRTLDKQG